MPFTLSHAAAVLPLARTRLPLSALVVGSVAPDLPYYLPLPVASATTHGPAGLWLDVLLGGIVLTVYVYAIRDPVHALAGRVYEPCPGEPGSGRRPVRAAVLTVVALAAGSVTHLAWDSFTQTGGALVRAWPLLSTQVVGPHLLYNVLMYASSALGLAALAWWVRRSRGRPGTNPPRPTRESASSGFRNPDPNGTDTLRGVPAPGVRATALAAVAVCAVAGAVLNGLSERATVSGYDLVRCLLVGAVTGTALGLTVWTAAWWGRLVPGARAKGP
ncbi:DUF4184 family protein [Nocardiopsis sp. NPDC058631]|uniref:DUF4184 family protein n=1 Tax=Nocardiopsis sp. NPDC058631 TaxID=3346566 RepID=UPI0036485459